MDFELSREQARIQKLARGFAVEEVLPLADRIEREDAIPEALIGKMAGLGLFGLPFPERYGGEGLGYGAAVLALEELARASGAVALRVGINYLASAPVDLFGSEEQKAEYLPPLCRGEGAGSFAWTEAATGSDPGALKTKATPEGDGYVLSGAKRFITAADLGGIIVIFARDGKGVSAFVGEKNAAGYSTPKTWEKPGMRGVSLNDIRLRGYRVPAVGVLGSRGGGYDILLDSIALGKLGTSAVILGCAQAALDEAVRYAGKRTARGRPIADFPTVQCLISDIAVPLEAARWLVYRLAALADRRQNIRAPSALTKIFVTEMAVEAARKAFRVHGAYGYVKNARIERLLRDINLGEVVEGASELQKIIVAQDLLK